MKWLKKSLLTAATLFILQTGNAQTFNYNIRFGIFDSKLGEILYNQNERKLSIDMNKININFSYYMPNDSTYIEISKNGNLHEKFIYSKIKVDDSRSWHLDEYIFLKGDEPRLEKIDIKDSVFQKDVSSAIETLEKLISNKLKDTNKVLIFGVPYKIIIEDKIIKYSGSFYEGNILSYQQDKKDKFLLEENLNVTSQKIGKQYIPKTVNVRTKLLNFIPVGARIKLK